jgi:hypothetical protein
MKVCHLLVTAEPLTQETFVNQRSRTINSGRWLYHARTTLQTERQNSSPTDERRPILHHTINPSPNLTPCRNRSVERRQQSTVATEVSPRCTPAVALRGRVLRAGSHLRRFDGAITATTPGRFPLSARNNKAKGHGRGCWDRKPRRPCLYWRGRDAGNC